MFREHGIYWAASGDPSRRTDRSRGAVPVNPIEQLIANFQDLVALVPEVIQPIILMLAGAIPFIEGEGAAIIGVVGGIPPIIPALAGATGNFLSVLLVVLLSSRARTAVVSRRDGRPEPAQPESKGRLRFKRWLVRFGVPGASILGPLAIPTQFTAAILVAGGTSRAWVLLWQGIAIAFWTTVGTVSLWLALQLVIQTA
jgi:hypothetical protein